jgi:hypothetical protein
MKCHKPILIPVCLSLILGLCSAANSQDRSAQIKGRPLSPVPGMFYGPLNSLGRRLLMSGKERTVYRGQLLDGAGNASPARVIHQLPGLVRLEGFRAQAAVLSFDGQNEHGITSRKSDEALLEIFTMDLAEGMLSSVQNGAAVRLLGRGFGPDPSWQPAYTGPRYDIYEVTGPIQCRQDQLTRMKLYYFDSSTGLLQSTRYYDRSVSPPFKIETRFSLWGNIDGSAYPARIDHYEGGQLVFTFIAEDIAGGASVDQADFQ